MAVPSDIWRFGSFELDRKHRRLSRDGVALTLTAKAFDVLMLLVERRGQLVTKEEMLRTLWPDSFVEEGNLSVYISVLRKRLGDSPEDHRFIVTVPGRGYQFVGGVEELPEAAADAPPPQRPEIVWRRSPPQTRRRAAGIAASVALLALGGWALSGWTPSGSERARLETRRRPDPEAERLYLRGRYMLGKRTEESLRRGIDYLIAATARDGQFAAAHSGIADGYGMLGYFAFDSPRDVFPLAQAAVTRALALDPDSAEAHTSLGYILHRYEWRFADAERAFLRAIELRPDYALARHWYASYLDAVRRHDEAIIQSAKAEELEPVSPVISANFATILSSAQLGSRAMAQWSKTLELDEGFWPAYLALAEIYAGRDMPNEALDAFRRAIELSGDNPRQLAALARYYVACGRIADARKMLGALKARSPRDWVSPADIASIHAVLGQRDEAFAWLDTAVEARDPQLAYLAESSQWQRLRDDPRFPGLLERVGLATVVQAGPR